MNPLKALLSGTFRAGEHSIEGPYPLTSQRLVELFSTPVDAGVSVTQETALGLSAVYRAVVMVSGDGAALPLHAYRRKEDGREDTTRQHAVLLDPHPELTIYEFWEMVFAHLQLWGNHFSLKVRGEPRNGQRGAVVTLEPLLPSRVRVGRTGGVKVFEVTLDSGQVVPFTSDEIFHVPAFGYDGVLGMSPIACCRQAIGLGIAAEKFGAKLFASGALFSGVLQTDRRLDDTTAKALKARWQEMTSGIRHAHETAILDSGAKFQPLSMSPEDAQFLETRRFGVTEVARIFGVPPHLLYETDKSTSWGSGLEEQSLGYLIHTLNPHLHRIAARVTKELLPRGQYAEHITEGVVQMDTVKQHEAFQSAINAGWMSRAEVRRKKNLPAGPPELEQFLVQTSMVAAEDLDEVTKQPVQQPAAPADDAGDDADAE